jgi:hypothetical protein
MNPESTPDGDRGVQRRRSAVSQIAEGYRTAHEIVSAAIALAALVGGGVWLDGKWSWFPAMTILGLTLGLIAAGVSFRNLLLRLDRETRQRRQRRPSDGTP